MRWRLTFWLLSIATRVAPEGPARDMLREDVQTWAADVVRIRRTKYRRATRRELRKRRARLRR